LWQFPASREIYFKNSRQTYGAGDTLKQKNLAASYRHIADEGVDWFYRGAFGDVVDKWMKRNGGILTAQDFRNYHICLREPITTTYRGYQIVAFPPPSSGGVHVVEMLNILESFDLKKMDETTRLHVIAEAMKLAFADRAYWLGDPDFVNVPRGLVDKQYGSELAKKINLEHTTVVPSHGLPPGWDKEFFKQHTTHFSVADAEGNWVACTTTVNTSYGSKVVIPGTGIVMNNQMDDFSAQPGATNYFKLIGAEANAVGPGKRPLSSMSPTMVLKDKQPILALGAAGGPTIISQVLFSLVNILDMGMSLDEAMSQPRLHHQWSPDQLMVEKTMPPELLKALEARGHEVGVTSAIGATQMVGRTKDGKEFIGVADPRASGKAEGW
jgi:gamma-glutamyltranspeptidase/glutathione hydrolase